MDKKHLDVPLQSKVNGYPESNIPPINGPAKAVLNQIMHISVDRRGSGEGRIKSHKSFKMNSVEENQMSQ